MYDILLGMYSCSGQFSRRGFTIVELLIVIVVIGILATIVVVAFNGVQNRANDAAVQSDLKALKTKLEAHKVLGVDSYYPNGGELTGALAGFRASKNAYSTSPTDTDNLVYCYSDANRAIFAVVAKSKSGARYMVAHDTNVQELTVAWNGATTCTNLSVGLNTNYRGYAATDTATGPWRAWTGVTN